MTLSIIIINFNTAKLTVQCIESIFKHTPKVAFEVIVVDNASTDESVKLLSKYKKIKLIKNNQNLGFAKANNQGIREAKGEYIFLLNSDTVITSQVFDEMIGFAKNHSNAGVVAPKLLNADKSLQASIFKLPSIWRALTRVWFDGDRLREKYALSTDEPEEVEAVVGAAFLITPKARKQVGLLNEKYFMYYEDLEYCKRVRQIGLKVYYLPSSSLIHLHGGSGDSKVNKYSLESSEIYFGKYRYHIYALIMRIGNKIRRILKLK